MRINIISAVCKNNGIGYNNKLPWHFSKDLKYFANLTKHDPQNGIKNAVLMGRNTWNSLAKPLPKRSNYVISRTMKDDFCFSSIDDCLDYCRQSQYTNAWIIGGQQIYTDAIVRDDIDYLYLTKIKEEYLCDTFFPEYYQKFECIKREATKEKGVGLLFEVYEQR